MNIHLLSWYPQALKKLHILMDLEETVLSRENICTKLTL